MAVIDFELMVTAGMILGAIFIGAVSPGPSFVLIARTAIGVTRADGIAASFGMGVGGCVFSILALLGLHAVLTTVPVLYMALKVVGGGYLLFIAYRIFRGAKEPLDMSIEGVPDGRNLKKSFLIGLGTHLSNPKAAIVYGSIFASLLPAQIPGAIYYVLPPLVFAVEAGWYITVALLLSSTLPRRAYLKSKTVFDRVAGSVMAGLALRLVYTVGHR